MLTWSVWRNASNETSTNESILMIHYGEGECLSTDTKPTDSIFNGSKLFEMDTSKLYMFDAESKDWLEWVT